MSQTHRAGRGPGWLSAIGHSPLLWGGVTSLGFYSLHAGEVLRGDFVDRYFAGHPVNYVETIAFFIALAALVLKALDVWGQFATVRGRVFPAVSPESQAVADCAAMQAQLDGLPAALGRSYLVRRLHAGLEHVRRNQSAAGLEEELKYLADQDAGAAHASYGLVRLIVWAIPILGFLGTVMGVTIAIASLSPEQLEKSLPQVVAGLGVAFDTTALALGLSMVLMFVQFLIDRVELRLLARVDEQVLMELAGRFEATPGGADPQLAAVRRMAETVLASSERLVERQSEIWQGTIEAARARWDEMFSRTQQVLEQGLAAGMSHSVEQHARHLAQSEERLEQGRQEHWTRVERALLSATESLRSQQAELARQGQTLLQVLEATGEVTRLEEVLNRNLHALSGAQNFEETLLSLSAAIHLLSARLGGASPRSTLGLHSPKSGNQAA